MVIKDLQSILEAVKGKAPEEVAFNKSTRQHPLNSNQRAALKRYQAKCGIK